MVINKFNLHQLPNFPYVPFLPSTRIKGFELLAKQLDSLLPLAVLDDSSITQAELVYEEPTPQAPNDVFITPQEVSEPASPTAEPLISVIDETGSALSPTSAYAAHPTLQTLRTPQATPVVPTETDFMLLLGGQSHVLDCSGWHLTDQLSQTSFTLTAHDLLEMTRTLSWLRIGKYMLLRTSEASTNAFVSNPSFKQ